MRETRFLFRCSRNAVLKAVPWPRIGARRDSQGGGCADAICSLQLCRSGEAQERPRTLAWRVREADTRGLASALESTDDRWIAHWRTAASAPENQWRRSAALRRCALCLQRHAPALHLDSPRRAAECRGTLVPQLLDSIEFASMLPIAKRLRGPSGAYGQAQHLGSPKR